MGFCRTAAKADNPATRLEPFPAHLRTRERILPLLEELGALSGDQVRVAAVHRASTDVAPRRPERRSDLELAVGGDAEDLHRLARHAPCWFEGVAGQSDARASSSGFDVLAWPRCGHAMRPIAPID
jgi:hypothetical protein